MDCVSKEMNPWTNEFLHGHPVFHDSMHTISAIVRLIKMIDPWSHPTISQDVVKSFIILYNELRKFYIFQLFLRNFTMMLFIISCPWYFQLFTHTPNTPMIVFIKNWFAKNQESYRSFPSLTSLRILSLNLAVRYVIQGCSLFVITFVMNTLFNDFFILPSLFFILLQPYRHLYWYYILKPNWTVCGISYFILILLKFFVLWDILQRLEA